MAHTATPRLRHTALLISLAFPASTAFADDQQLGSVVVSATGFEQKVTDAPASISVVTSEELAKKPYTTLIDAVRDLEGVDVGETSDKTGQKTISMRGMGSDYTLILIDGKRQNNHGDIYPNSFGGNQFNHIPPLDSVERIEVIRGPASTLYGADAMGGVINIITKKDITKWTGSITYGRSLQTNNDFGDDITTDFAVRGPILPGKLGVALRGSVYERQASTPEFKSTTDPDGIVHTRALAFGGGGKTVDNTNKAYGISLFFTPTEHQRITFDYDDSVQEYDNKPVYDPASGEVAYPLGTVDSIDTIWRRSNSGGGRADPRVGYLDEQEFTRESWSLSHEGKWDFGTSFVSLSYVETDNNGRTMPFTVAERRQLLEMIDGTGAYAGMSLADRKAAAQNTFLPRKKRTLQSNQYTLDAKLDIPLQNLAGDHLLVLGGQVIDGELKDGVFGMESGTPGKIQENKMWSLFVEDNWMPNDAFTLTAGVRYDDHDVFGDHISPRLYGVYKVAPQWTVKGGVSTGYKTPKTTQLYDGIVGFGGQGTSPMYGNPNLEPETSRNTELAVYWNHPAGHNFNATVFRNDFEDKIANQPCGPGTPQACASAGEYADIGYNPGTNRATNIDKVVIQGVELAGRWQIADNWALRGNYTYTDSEQKSGAQKGLPLNYTAKHMFNTTLDWQALDNLNVFLTMEARSKRYRGLVDNKVSHYKDYEVFHLGASLRVNEHVTINGRINNLLDEDFTTYKHSFTYDAAEGAWSPTYTDDYNNKDKSRNFWVSVNATF
ncbi:TonB-dependent receptor domain-containing protein [Thauera linaloolentis]|uniref:TonB-dependent receptor n=1 Tax=Thauera linaloolentis (strain DSM 12138 / JCM 21573 / CCUG 41526 / CIP 105981 / IAM 15112 / NBRC 102519 / 47Lol) TaxID=1123367 RepID=N6Z2M0_THAL4|nr:TonB-dependent receptor [Thauera linaloolentis]ENO88623.1 TonB-dependent receptor [Thauera linaloolentis 47Lol = DSM 12138]MCM8565668.1 TonB-dependent receptor [Thauera linaloolentis]